MTTRFIELSGEVNTAMPAYVVERVAAALNNRSKAVRGSRAAIQGAAYKRDVDDVRESLAFRTVELLEERGAVLSCNDPHVPVMPRSKYYRLPDLTSEPLTADHLGRQDCVVVVTDHSAYDWDFVLRHAGLIVDTRIATAGRPSNGVVYAA